MANRTNLRRQKARSPYQIIRDEIADGGYKRYGLSVLVAGTLVGWTAMLIA